MVTQSRYWRSRVHRAFAVAALAVLAVLAAGCGSGTSDTAGTSGGGGKTTLTMKAITDNQKSWEELIAQYKKANPDVTIKASFAPTDQLQTALRAQLGAGGAPDMFVVWPGNGSAMSVKQLAPTGLLADLTDQDWVKTIPESTRPLLGVKDKTYIWSPSTTPIGVIYNKQVFKQAGVDKLPTTYDEFLAAGEKIKKAGKIPIALGLQTPWVTQLIPYAIAPATAFVDDPNLAKDMQAGKKSFTNSKWNEVFDRYLDLDKRGFFNPNPNGTTFEQQTEMVASGKAAMSVQVTGVIPAYLAAAKNPEEIGTFPFPASDSADQLKIAAGISAGLGVSAKTTKMDAAKAFTKWLGEPKQMATFAKGGYAVPLVSTGGKLDPLVEPFAPYVKENKAFPFMDQEWPNAKVQPVHFAAVQELFAGKKTVPQVLKDLDQAYKQK
jgi:raffinose/stachyose/melibiose transport system substrate-binding protein